MVFVKHEDTISIHALLAESDCRQSCTRPRRPLFLSTLSLRRATTDGLFFFGRRNNFYPRSPCGERRVVREPTAARNDKFLSTLSLRRATRGDQHRHQQHDISIHALLAESDPTDQTITITGRYFYPRSPCGERLFFVGDILCTNPISIHALLAESDPITCCPHMRHVVFLSTLSLRRATSKNAAIGKPTLISIHALLAESDLAERRTVQRILHFYPRSPCGERPAHRFDSGKASGISIHALLAESDY